MRLDHTVIPKHRKTQRFPVPVFGEFIAGFIPRLPETQWVFRPRFSVQDCLGEYLDAGDRIGHWPKDRGDGFLPLSGIQRTLIG